ncbi:hypothetical protein WDZ92_54475, partial [Nostoc sp. NIES-2111]
TIAHTYWRNQITLVVARRADLAAPLPFAAGSKAFHLWQASPGFDVNAWSSYRHLKLAIMLDVFNAHALLFGSTLMVLCLILQAVGVVIVMNHVKPAVSRLIARRQMALAQCTFFLGALVLMLSHLIQIYAWGAALNLAGALTNEHQAMLFAGSTYTTVGFITDPLSLDWQLAAIIMATNGLFAFAWSTSALFGLSRVLYP